MELPKRKSMRLKEYDYSQNGAYFITICTRNRQDLFGFIVDGVVKLSDYGKIVCDTYIDLPNHNPQLILDKFTIMPNHIHGIIVICRERSVTVPKQRSHGIPEIIRQLKSFSSKRINEYRLRNGLEPFPTNTTWQKSYHDHIIRNEEEYQEVWQYIDQNPAKWADDCYYSRP